MSITFIVANKFATGNTEIAGEKYFTDCTVSISHNFSNSVTEHPVETGVTFSDHVQVQSNKFTVSGIFGQYGLNDYQADTLSRGLERIQQAYKFLRKLRDQKLTFTLVSKYETYYDCVIESLNIPVNADSSNSLYFDIAITQIRKATTESVNLTIISKNISNSKQDTASGTANGGKQLPTSTLYYGGELGVSVANDARKAFFGVTNIKEDPDGGK
jgi:hypothetical protein